MGTVYRARDPRLERDVAIKVLSHAPPAAGALNTRDTVDLRGDAVAPARDDLLAEARMMARLSHPNVLPIYEVGIDEAGCVFLVMELVDGGNLRTWLAAPRDAREVRAVFAQATRGLAAAHARGIVHRDFKPDNVLIDGEGRARVADFGLSGVVIGVPAAMVRIDDGRGTPRYMAPELLDGAVATPASDVYALCRSLADALPDGVPAVLRETIAAGLAEDPAARPALGRVLEVLEAEPPRRRGRALAIGAVALLAVGGGGAAAWLHARGGGACPIDPIDAAWNDDARSTLQRAFAASKLADSSATAARALAAIDAEAVDLAAAWRASCDARGTLGDAQVTAQQACLARRALDVAALVRSLAAAPITNLAQTEVRASYLPLPAAACADTTASPVIADPALYDRLAALAAAPPAEQLALATAIARDADASGDHELAARAQIELATALRLGDRLTEADAALDRAHESALAMHASSLVARTLVDKSKLATRAGDLGAAQGYVKLAEELAATPALGPRDHLRVLIARVRIDEERGELPAALRDIEAGLAYAASHRAMSDLEGSLLNDRITTMQSMEGKLPETIALARAYVPWAKVHYGETGANYGVALNILASLLQDTNDGFPEALALRRQALDVMTASMGPASSFTLLQRSDLGSALILAGQAAEARDVFQAGLDATEHNEGLRKYRASQLENLAVANRQLGAHAVALDLIARAVDEYVVAFGRDHPEGLHARTTLVDWELDLGRVDEAARNVASLEESYARRPESTAVRLAQLHGDEAARISIARGDAAGAEKQSRLALAALDEVKAEPYDRVWVLRALGQSLAAQRRWREAARALDDALALAKPRYRIDDLAELQVSRAEVAVGLGELADARALVAAARAAFATYPSHATAETRAAALAARLGAR